jgi:general secretion pathway protein A
MYTSFFGLGEKPFAITPDPRYLYMSERHAEALAHLLYGMTEAGGFIQLTGEVGTGKTTVVRTLLERMPGHADVAVILNPQLTPLEFVRTICEELGLAVAAQDASSIKDVVDRLNQHLLDAHARGRRIVLIVDEAQNLTADTLEQVRLLTNLETASQKLLQIILIGQPELREMLDRVELRQLAQRITGRYHLAPLSRPETAAYINHRLRVAGANREIFTTAALREVHRLSKGIPRIINVICDRALLGAFTRQQHYIGPAMLRAAAGEVYGRSISPPWTQVLAGAAVGVMALTLAVAGWHFLRSPSAVPATVSTTAASAAPSAAEPVTEPAAPSAPPTGPAASDIAPLLTIDPAQHQTMAAFARLLTLWGGYLDPAGSAPCDQALEQGLECVYQQGSWAQLRTLNRPAILTLVDHDQEQQVVISALDDETARVELADGPQQVTLNSLSRLWHGDYLVLWRPPVSPPRSLSAGMRGPGVTWLRERLALLDGALADPTASDLFDPGLARQIEDFQRQYRLNVDGIAGVQTQLLLDTLTGDPAEPVLLSAVQGAS